MDSFFKHANTWVPNNAQLTNVWHDFQAKKATMEYFHSYFTETHQRLPILLERSLLKLKATNHPLLVHMGVNDYLDKLNTEQSAQLLECMMVCYICTLLGGFDMNALPTSILGSFFRNVAKFAGGSSSSGGGSGMNLGNIQEILNPEFLTSFLQKPETKQLFSQIEQISEVAQQAFSTPPSNSQARLQ